MFVVIFEAELDQTDEEYLNLAEQLRTTAIAEYGCQAINAVTEQGKEITLSYWPSLEHIKRWQQQSLHLKAQELGQRRYYKHYTVTVAKIQYDYAKGEGAAAR